MINLMKFKNCLLTITLFLSCNNVFASEYDAVIDLPKGVELSLPVSGVIKTLNVVAGQFMEQGEIMLVLDQTPFKAAKVYAESRVTVQQTLLKESIRDFNNRQELYDRTVLASVQLENAELRVKRDTAYLNNAMAQLDVADYELSYSKLSAPFSSLILSVHVNQGQSINNSIASKTLITLVKRGHYLARFSVTADAFENLQIDQSIIVKTQGENYKGKISAISFEHVKAGAEQNNLYMIEAGFASDKKLLPLGNKVVVEIN
jgi:membrane fusion protein (multidrug efflux system)